MLSFFEDVVIITALTISVTAVLVLVMGRRHAKQRRDGTLPRRALIDYTAGEMLIELLHTYETGLGSIDGLKAVDLYLEKKKSLYPAESLLNDTELILRAGAFTGTVLRHAKHYRWKFKDDIPLMHKKGTTVYPFELIKQKIDGSLNSVYEYCKDL